MRKNEKIQVLLDNLSKSFGENDSESLELISLIRDELAHLQDNLTVNRVGFLKDDEARSGRIVDIKFREATGKWSNEAKALDIIESVTVIDELTGELSEREYFKVLYGSLVD